MTAPRAGEADLPLSGIRVIDMSTAVAGPAACRLLADYGADVIRIESHAHHDSARHAPPFFERRIGIDRSAFFAQYNAGKRSLALDLRVESARDILRRLVEVSHVLVESFRPGVMERLGIPYAVLAKWNPALVVASHSLQGQDGPRSSLRGYGALTTALGGWTDLTGYPDQPPVGPYFAYTDYLAWPYLAAAVLLALEEAEATGRGAHIDHTQAETSAYLLGPELLAVQRGEPPARRGAADPERCPHGVYPARGADEWVALCVDDAAGWRLLRRALDLREFGEARFDDAAVRIAHREAIDRAVAAATAARPADALAAALRDAGVPAARLQRPSDLFRDADLAARSTLAPIPAGSVPEHRVLAAPFRIDGVPAGPRGPAPGLGRDSAEVAREVAALTEAEWIAAIASGAIA